MKTLFLDESGDHNLSVIDPVVTPIGRQVLGKPVREDYAIVASKFRRSPHGRIKGYGLMVLPK